MEGTRFVSDEARMKCAWSAENNDIFTKTKHERSAVAVVSA